MTWYDNKKNLSNNTIPSLIPLSIPTVVSGGSEDRTMSAPGSPGGSFRRKPGRGRLGKLTPGQTSSFTFAVQKLSFYSSNLAFYSSIR